MLIFPGGLWLWDWGLKLTRLFTLLWLHHHFFKSTVPNPRASDRYRSVAQERLGTAGLEQELKSECIMVILTAGKHRKEEVGLANSTLTFRSKSQWTAFSEGFWGGDFYTHIYTLYSHIVKWPYDHAVFFYHILSFSLWDLYGKLHHMCFHNAWVLMYGWSM